MRRVDGAGTGAQHAGKPLSRDAADPPARREAGLANIVTVFALYQLGALPRCHPHGPCLLGGLFAGNASAMLFSLLGGLTAMLVMILLRRLRCLSIYGVSIGGAARP